MIKERQVGDRPEMVPVRFKEAGSLDAIVRAQGPNRFEFHLTSQK